MFPNMLTQLAPALCPTYQKKRRSSCSDPPPRYKSDVERRKCICQISLSTLPPPYRLTNQPLCLIQHHSLNTRLLTGLFFIIIAICSPSLARLLPQLLACGQRSTARSQVLAGTVATGFTQDEADCRCGLLVLAELQMLATCSLLKCNTIFLFFIHPSAHSAHPGSSY